MTREEDANPGETHFAPARRASRESLEASRRAFLSNEVAVKLLEAISDPAVVLNAERQIVAANARLRALLDLHSLDEAFGLRLGEALHCLNCPHSEAGCGTGPYCVQCGAVQATLESIEGRSTVSRECRLRSMRGEEEHALDLEVQATFVEVAGADLLVVALRDISAEKRREVLERVFFHDVLNTAVSLNALAQFLSSDQPSDVLDEFTCRRDLLQVSEQMLEEIVAQRQLLAAEQGELQPSWSTWSVRPLLESVVARFRPRESGEAPSVVLAEAPNCLFVTDVVLLRRVLVNLIKNAREAIAPGECVTVRAREDGDEIVFEVHNPGVMSAAVQRQMFQRSFTTKEGPGRGIGTYSIRLFTERHLGGRVSFESREPEGTTFRVRVPKNPEL